MGAARALQHSADRFPSTSDLCANDLKDNNNDAALGPGKHLKEINRGKPFGSTMEGQADPITRNLPHEITGYIFEIYIYLHAKPIDPNNKNSERITHPRVALTLSAVCRKWRAIACLSHRLWTSLSINLLSAGHAHGPVLVQQWLERTGDLPISVQICRDSKNSRLRKLKGLGKANAKSVMAILDSYSAKIINLDIRNVPLSISSLLTTPSTRSVLQILLVGGSMDEDLIMQDEIRFFRGADTKHSPVVLSLICPLPPSVLNIHWSNVIDLCLGYVCRDIAIEAIKLTAPRLQYLTLTDEHSNRLGIEGNDWPSRATHPIDLPALIFLSYTEMEAPMGTAISLFNTVRVPCLISLEYHGLSQEDWYMPIQEIIGCIHRSACSIKELVVDYAVLLDFSDLLPLLRETPSLERLDISLTPDDSVEPLLRRLQHVHDEPLFLPRLCDLKLSVYKRFKWASLAKIWQEDGPFGSRGQYIEEKFEVLLERMDLEAYVIVRNTSGRTQYLMPEEVSAFMKINRIVNGGVKIHQSGSHGSSWGILIDLLEASRFPCIAIDER